MAIDPKTTRTLLLIMTTFTYLLLGAAVFDWLESGEDAKLREEIAKIQTRMYSKYNFTSTDIELLETIIVKGMSHKAGFQWHFPGALYFATLVITTVGKIILHTSPILLTRIGLPVPTDGCYGHSSPETSEGKLFCMMFALAGIPLGLIMFQSIGERVNTFTAFCLHRVRDYCHRHSKPYLREVTPTHLLVVSLSIGTAIIIAGTYTFHVKENWSLFDAYYHCFITLSTIGFGDFVPLQQAFAPREEPGYYLFTLLFVLVGLAVFSACVNLLVLGFMAPNEDEVTAAHREPTSAIVLERFARSNSIVDSQLVGLQRPSKDSVAARNIRLRKRLFSIAPSSKFSDISQKSKLSEFFGEMCSVCFGRKLSDSKQKPTKYTLKRPPTQNIEHLLEPELRLSCSDLELSLGDQML
ncbi:hypothetical protein WR25_26067 [Diploscapter pachys]|uniref:Two pore potassium channel protein sup-9 n=1 Tax=Diploscapter pachys TaxID=2018661 RepID=A0A2A2K7G6_9BILA|nr:hypothetical protein WR25_26067 [Diploscapter pachys]